MWSNVDSAVQRLVVLIIWNWPNKSSIGVCVCSRETPDLNFPVSRCSHVARLKISAHFIQHDFTPLLRRTENSAHHPSSPKSAFEPESSPYCTLKFPLHLFHLAWYFYILKSQLVFFFRIRFQIADNKRHCLLRGLKKWMLVRKAPSNSQLRSLATLFPQSRGSGEYMYILLVSFAMIRPCSYPQELRVIFKRWKCYFGSPQKQQDPAGFSKDNGNVRRGADSSWDWKCGFRTGCWRLQMCCHQRARLGHERSQSHCRRG